MSGWWPSPRGTPIPFSSGQGRVNPGGHVLPHSPRVRPRRGGLSISQRRARPWRKSCSPPRGTEPCERFFAPIMGPCFWKTRVLPAPCPTLKSPPASGRALEENWCPRIGRRPRAHIPRGQRTAIDTVMGIPWAAWVNNEVLLHDEQQCAHTEELFVNLFSDQLERQTKKKQFFEA